MQIKLNYTCTKFCKYTESGCLEKTSKLDKIITQKLWRKMPLIWKNIHYLRLKHGLYSGHFWCYVN
jgi:hypothetical protein